MATRKNKNETPETEIDLLEEEVEETEEEEVEETEEEASTGRKNAKTVVPDELSDEKFLETATTCLMLVTTGEVKAEDRQLYTGRDSAGRALLQAHLPSNEEGGQELTVYEAADLSEDSRKFLVEISKKSGANLFPKNLSHSPGQYVGILLHENVVAIGVVISYNRGRVRPTFEVGESTTYPVVHDTTGESSGSSGGPGRPAKSLIAAIDNALTKGLERPVLEMVFEGHMDLVEKRAVELEIEI